MIRYIPQLRLRTILLIVHLFVLIVPLICIYGFRLYENQLVRETESELIAQGAYISAIYKHLLLPMIPDVQSYGRTLQHHMSQVDEKYTIIHPQLNLGESDILASRPTATNTTLAPDPYANKAAQAIFPAIAEATLTTLAGVRIVDYQGIVVAGREEMGKSLLSVEEVASALNGQYSAHLRVRYSDHQDPPLTSISRGARIRAFVAIPITHQDRVLGAILLSRSPRNILKGLYDERHHLLMAGSIILSLTILFALLTSHAIARPIYGLIEQTQRIARGEKKSAPIHTMTQELGLLSENITQMADTIATRSDYIHHFAMHVSHEFKTPLTAINGAIELISEHGNTMPPAQLQKFLTNITKDTHRLKLLVTRLLELARADVMAISDEQTDISGLLEIVKSRYPDSIAIVAPQQPLHAHVANEVLETVLVNLIHNALQHGAQHITITVSVVGHHLHIDIKNDGTPISDANRLKLFTPFFTTTREQGGTGLGLVISRSLLRAFNAEIACFPAQEGAHFSILLKNAKAS
jgi:signal transduction histidine kinase